MKYFRMDVSLKDFHKRIQIAYQSLFKGTIILEFTEDEVKDLVRGVEYAREHPLNL